MPESDNELNTEIADIIDEHRFSTVSKRHPWAKSNGTGDCGCGWGYGHPRGRCDWSGKYVDHSAHVADVLATKFCIQRSSAASAGPTEGGVDHQ